jgi:hypothetical protein
MHGTLVLLKDVQTLIFLNTFNLKNRPIIIIIINT